MVQQEMSRLLHGHRGTVVVMDDILFFGKTEEVHDENLQAVLKTVKEPGLKLNCEKCHFNKSELLYFRHIISSDGIKPDTNKVKVKRCPDLKMSPIMRNCLGKFVPGMSTDI